MNQAKIITEKEKIIKDLQHDLNTLKAQSDSLQDKNNSMSKRIEDMTTELEEAKGQCEKMNVLEDSNNKLNNDLIKLTEEYTQGLPEIYNSFDELVQAMKKSTNSYATKAATKEFKSIDMFDQSSKKDIKDMARNCIQVLNGLLNDGKKSKVVLNKPFENAKKVDGNKKLNPKKDVNVKKINAEKKPGDTSSHVDRTKKDSKGTTKSVADNIKSEPKSSERSITENKNIVKNESKDSINWKSKNNSEDLHGEDKKTSRDRNERVGEVSNKYEDLSSQLQNYLNPENSASTFKIHEESMVSPSFIKPNDDHIEDATFKLTSVKKEPAKVEIDFVQSAIYKLIGQDDGNEETKLSPNGTKTEECTKECEPKMLNAKLDFDQFERQLKKDLANSNERKSWRDIRNLENKQKSIMKGRNVSGLSNSCSSMSKYEHKKAPINLNKNYTVTQLYNNYTRTFSDFFDPSLQYGGESVYSYD